jgi:hypothetical protein
VPILGCLIGILCANARFNHIEQEVMYAIAPQRMPIDTCSWHTGHYCYPVCQLSVPNRFGLFSRNVRTKVVSCVPTAVYRSYSIAHFSKKVLARRIPICSAQDSKVVSGTEHR